MRRTITISMSEQMFDHINAERGPGTLSEYIRSLVRREQERRADYRSRPVAGRPMLANDARTFADALDQIDRLRAILERKEDYDA